MKNPKLIYDFKQALHTTACSHAANNLRESYPQIDECEIHRIIHIARKDFQNAVSKEIERRWFSGGGKTGKKKLLKEMKEEEQYCHIESEDWDHIAKGME